MRLISSQFGKRLKANALLLFIPLLIQTRIDSTRRTTLQANDEIHVFSVWESQVHCDLHWFMKLYEFKDVLANTAIVLIELGLSSDQRHQRLVKQEFIEWIRAPKVRAKDAMDVSESESQVRETQTRTDKCMHWVESEGTGGAHKPWLGLQRLH